jgi:myosin-15
MSGDPQSLAEFEPPTPISSKDAPQKQKALRRSLSYPLATCDQTKATWPPWRRWKTLTRVPAPLAPTRVPVPLFKESEQPQAGPGRFAVVMPQVRGLSSFQPAGPAILQPPEQPAQDPQHSPECQAWSLRWSRFWLPADLHWPWPRIHARSHSHHLGPGAACLPLRGPRKEVSPQSWQNKVWGNRSEGGYGNSGLGSRAGGNLRSPLQPRPAASCMGLNVPILGCENSLGLLSLWRLNEGMPSTRSPCEGFWTR